MLGTDNTNPGNFANRSAEEVKKNARKGGQSSHSGGFASMDSDKQVRVSSFYSKVRVLLTTFYIQRDIASQGGHASGGSFEPGDQREREAGYKGGKSSGLDRPEEWALMLQDPSTCLPIHFKYEVQDLCKTFQDIPYSMTEVVACVGSWLWTYKVHNEKTQIIIAIYYVILSRLPR